MLLTGGTCEVDLTVASHPHTLIHSQPGSVALEADAERPWDNVDFVVGYGVWRDSITATVHVELPADEDELSADNPDARGSFCVSVSPPGGWMHRIKDGASCSVVEPQCLPARHDFYTSCLLDTVLKVPACLWHIQLPSFDMALKCTTVLATPKVRHP